MPPLMRRREVWWPTTWGWALFACAMVLAVWAASTHARDYLAIDKPAVTVDGRGARVLIVEGWLGPKELDQVVSVWRRAHYERLITSGGPIGAFTTYSNYADRAADYLRTHGLADVQIDAVPSPETKQDRTYASALWVRDWAASRSIPMSSLDVLTHDVHARRTRTLYRMAFGPAVAVGVRSTESSELDTRRWWTSSYAFKTMLGESLSLAYTTCCFWPATRGSHEERWAVPADRPASR